MDGNFVVHEIPEEARGQVYVVLTKNDTMATDDTILAGPAIIEVTAPEPPAPTPAPAAMVDEPEPAPEPTTSACP